MTPHNRVLAFVGGIALIASFAVGAVLFQTTGAESVLQADQSSAHTVDALGDRLLVAVREQQDALDDYILSHDPQALERYRAAEAEEALIADRVGSSAAHLAGVEAALIAVDADNDAWRSSIAEPVIAAMTSGRGSAAAEAIAVRVEQQETSQGVAAGLVKATDDAALDLARRSDALSSLRVTASVAGVTIELLAAGLSLLFVRRYGVRVARDERRRERASVERVQIVASLRTLRTGATPEGTAAVIAEALNRLPWIDVAGVFERTDVGFVALAVAGPPGFPIQAGYAFSADQTRYLLERSNAGPWAQPWIAAASPSATGDILQPFGIKSMAFAPIQVGGEVIGLIAFATTDEEHGRHLVEDLPAVDEFASVAETILAPALVARRERTAERQRIAETIAAAGFRPVFQPVVHLLTRRTVGFEALTRFDDGSSPDDVFAVAVGCGMGIQLELATLEVALREGRRLPADAWLSLNVSPALLAKGGDTLSRILAGMPGPVILEVTEHDAIEAYGPLREAMARLGPGVELAVDDAGAGVANFNHLVELHPDLVKIDIGLVRGVDKDPGRQAVVAGLVHFATRTGCKVLAEGIETEAELATVMELGVTLGQGYLLARPAPVATWETGVLDVPPKVGLPRSRARTAGRVPPIPGVFPAVVH